MKILIAIFAIGIFTGSFGYGRTIFENFQGYDVGESGIYISDFYFYTDSSAGVSFPVLVDEVDEVEGIQAAGFSLGAKDWWGNTLFAPGDWAYFETTNLIDSWTPASWFQSHLAFVPNQNVAAANPDNPSLIDEVWWYAYADTTGDGIDDRFFESRATSVNDEGSPLNNSSTLQAYPTRFFQGDEWDEYVPNADPEEDYEFVGTSADVDYSFLGSLTAVGIQIRSSLFNTAEEDDYLSVWVDEFSVESEPKPRRGRPQFVSMPPPDVRPIDRPVGVSR